MKKISSAILLLSASFIMYSCGGDATNGDTTSSDTTASENASGNMTSADTTSTANRMGADTGSASGTTGATSSQPLDKEATDFVMKAASGGMMEVELGKVAQENAKSERVKNFGSMMVTDHSNANNELKSIASAKNVTIPTTLLPEHQKHMDMLKGKTGAAFDKAYTSMMVADHKKDIAEFQKAAEKGTDADIKSFASKTLPVLQKHLDSVQAIHGSKM